ncbi:MAG TPA: hypothetical protein VKQ28_16685 [Candidatus Acidoferrum sp.]|nr:hypothetical protein [Candidatus Acidoferrum sp.]
MTSANLKNIPTGLTEKDRWLAWRLQMRSHKVTKVPYCAATGEMASTTDPATWCSFPEAVNAFQSGRYSGIGFVFTIDDDIVGIDLDKCRDEKTGRLDEKARQIVAKFDSYTEISPSGRGLHIFVRGLLPPGPRRRRTIVSV